MLAEESPKISISLLLTYITAHDATMIGDDLSMIN